MSADEGHPRDWIVQIMNHVEGQVVFGDTKAGQLLATNSLLLAGLGLLAKDVREEVAQATLILGVLAALSLGASLALILVSIAPSQRILRGPSSLRRNAV